MKKRLILVTQIIEGWFKYLIGKQEKYEILRKPHCSICDHNTKGICSICGCFLEAKIKCKKCSCPLSKW